MKSLILIALPIILLSGCSTPSTVGPSSEIMSALPLVQEYKIPTASIPCSTNSDSEVDRIQKGMYQAGVKRGFTIDGSHASEGALVFSTEGEANPITVLVVVFRRADTGELVIEHSNKYMMPDHDQAVAYTNSVVKFLSGK